MLTTTEFILQLDESTLPGNESLLLAYVRFIKVGTLCQELLFARLLELDTTGESVYRAVEDNFQKKKHSAYKHHLMCYRWRPDKVKSSKTDIAYLTEMVFQIQWSEFAAARWWYFINQSQVHPLGIPLCRNHGRREFLSFLVCLTWRRKQKWRTMTLLCIALI